MSAVTTKEKRQRKIPNKFKESLVQPKSRSKANPGKTSEPKWFTLLCLEDNKKYISTVKSMETTDGLEASGEELQVGDSVIWNYRGAPYEAQICSVHDKKPMPSDCNKQSNKRKYIEDSSDDSDDSSHPPSKQAALRKERNNSSVSVSNVVSSHAPPKSVTPLEECNHSPVTVSDVDSSPVKINSVTNIEDRLFSLSQKITGKSGGHAHPPQLPLSQKATPTDLVSQTSVERLSPTLSPQKIPPSKDLFQKLLIIEKHLLRVEQKVDRVMQHVASGPHPMKMEEAGPSTLSLKQPPTDEKKFVTEAGVNLLALRACNPGKYALTLLDALFTDEEMGRSCYSRTSRSVKPALPAEKISLLEECIDYKFGTGTVNANRDNISNVVTRSASTKGIQTRD